MGTKITFNVEDHLYGFRWYSKVGLALVMVPAVVCSIVVLSMTGGLGVITGYICASLLAVAIVTGLEWLKIQYKNAQARAFYDELQRVENVLPSGVYNALMQPDPAFKMLSRKACYDSMKRRVDEKAGESEDSFLTQLTARIQQVKARDAALHDGRSEAFVMLSMMAILIPLSVAWLDVHLTVVIPGLLVIAAPPMLVIAPVLAVVGGYLLAQALYQAYCYHDNRCEPSQSLFAEAVDVTSPDAQLGAEIPMVPVTTRTTPARSPSPDDAGPGGVDFEMTEDGKLNPVKQ